MSKAVENKLVEMLDAVQNGAVKIGKKVVKYTPTVVNATLNVIRIDAIQGLIYGLLALTYFTVDSFVLYHQYLLSLSDVRGVESNPIIVFAGLLTGFLTLPIMAVSLFDIWTYVAIFNPKLELARRLVNKVTDTHTED